MVAALGFQQASFAQHFPFLDKTATQADAVWKFGGIAAGTAAPIRMGKRHVRLASALSPARDFFLRDSHDRFSTGASQGPLTNGRGRVRMGQVEHGPACVQARRRGYDRRLFKKERASATADA